MATLLGIDPGGTSGFCIYNEADRSIHAFEVGPEEHHTRLWASLEYYNPEGIVCEAFDNRGKAGALLVSLEYIGIAKLWAQKNRRPIAIQGPGGPKGFWVDGKLKAINCYYRTNGSHANDAVRHVLYFISETMNDKYFINLWGKMTQRV